MLHPVLPNDQPSIVKPSKPVNPISSTSVAETRIELHQVVTLEKKLDQHLPSTPIQSHQRNLVVAENLSRKTHPETVSPEFSPLNIKRSAAFLGKPLSVGNTKVAKSESDQDSNIGFPSAKTSVIFPNASTVPIQSRQLKTNSDQKSRLLKSEFVAQNSEPVRLPSVITTKDAVGRINLSVSAPKNLSSSQPKQNILEFNSRNPTNQPLKPFKFIPHILPNPLFSHNKKKLSSTEVVTDRVVNITSDYQEYDEKLRIVTASGNVKLRFDESLVDADRLQVNLDNLIAVGNGNVALTRGAQVLRGERFTYNFIQDSGQIENGSGEIYIPKTATDFAFPSADVTAGAALSYPASDRIRANQPLTDVSSAGGLNFTFGGRSGASNLAVPKSGGLVKRLRFEAKMIDFYPRGWQARNVRITNDPFSPPELELRASKITVTQQAPLIQTIKTQNQRLVFDQNVTLPLPIDERTIDRRPREVTPTIVSLGYDGGVRGGLFIERGFTPINREGLRWSITPQFYVQKAAQNFDNVPGLFGIKSRINAVFSPKTTLQGSGELTSLDLSKLDTNLKMNLVLRQVLGDRHPYLFNTEYTYRDRFYNGTLGYQTVQSSLGSVLLSPAIPVGKTGFNLTYQVGTQYIDANTDRQDLLLPQRQNDRISLGRLQGSASVSRGYSLWSGKPLPATPNEGLKYTSSPVVPYLQAFGGVTATSSYYTSGDNQSTLTGTIGIAGQIGHFSRPYLDYTAFNLSYSQGINSGLSPFLFDRSVDNRVLSGGITQQIYGPIRFGFQLGFNLDTGKAVNSDYILEYSRRTYGITLRYNPTLQLGAFSIRIADFNWSGGTDPFVGGEVKSVVRGVLQDQ